MMKKCLITGGAGFLGIHLTRKFLQAGIAVHLFDLAPLQDDDLKSRVVMTLHDVRDKAKVAQAINGADTVIHAAAALPISGSKEKIFATNVLGTKNVLEAALANQVKKVIFLSSTSVYGVPKVHPISETTPLTPLGHYGASKVAAEKLCEEFRKKGLDVVILRPKTFIGPYRLGVFQILFEWLRQGKNIYTIGSGKNRYQLLAVSDLVDAILRVATLPCTNATLNLGAKEFKTVREELEALIAYAGTKSKVVSLPAWPAQKALRLLELLNLSPLAEWHYKTASRDSFLDISYAETMLGWQPQKSNINTLKENYDWYLENAEHLLLRKGLTHRTAWDEKILKIIKRFS